MNSNQYSCNVVIVGLMAQLCLPEGKPSVSFWGKDSLGVPAELDLRYGVGEIQFRGVDKAWIQTKLLGLIEESGTYILFMKGNAFLDAYLF